MKLEDIPMPEPTPADIAKAVAEPVFPINPKKVGFGYYQLRFGTIAYKAAERLMATKSGVLSLPTLNMKNNARTIQAQLQQGAKYILDGGWVHIQAASPEARELVIKALGRMVVKIKKNNVILHLPEEGHDDESAILSALQEVDVSVAAANDLDRLAFREKFMEFLNGPDGQVFAPDDKLQHYPNVPPEEAEKIEQIIKTHPERHRFLFDYDHSTTTLYLSKLSDEQLESLK